MASEDEIRMFCDMNVRAEKSARFIAADRATRTGLAILALFTLLLAGGFIVADGMSPAGRRLSKVTGIDPAGYFGVSHALLFHRNFNLTEEFTRVKPDDNPWTALRKETGLPGTTWAVGYSILAMPFLGTGTLVDAVAGNPADGYSRFAILAYCMTNIALTGLGMIALFLFLRNLAEFWDISVPNSATYALFATFATFFGTSAGYYALSPMSHASTFFCVSMFLACWWQVRDRTDVRAWVVLGLIGGFLSISRWQEFFFIAAPVMSDLLRSPLDLRKRFVSRVAYLIAAAVCWIPQVIEWKYIFNKFSPASPGDNFFVFPPPNILQVLFSTRNGWVAWTPLVLPGIIGLIWAAIRIPRLFLPWIVVMSLELSFVASMRTWNGGEGFGNRYMTSSTPLIALGVLALLCFTSRYVRALVVIVTIVCCLFALISAVQFRLDLVPRFDRLTPSEYLTDKLRLRQARRRKIAVQEAENLLQRGSADEAARVLENAVSFGPDRGALKVLSEVYRKSGRSADAKDAERRLDLLDQSRLF